MPVLSAILAICLAAIPPLTSDQRTQLMTAYDGRDHQEPAFAALVENVESWTPGAGDAPLRLEPELSAMIADPEAFRGDLCRITGVIQQQTPLPRPWAMASEWFVRVEDGTPVLIYVISDPDDAPLPFDAGDRIEVDARFYKRVDAVARDGTERSYAAFVGAHPRNALSAAGDPLGGMFIIVMLVVVVGLLIVFVPLLVWARSRRGARQNTRRRLAFDDDPSHQLPGGVDDGGALPDDPADALAVLRQRAKAGGS